MPSNDSKLRSYVKKYLEKGLPGATVKCDEENNAPDVVDGNCLVARVCWDKKDLGETVYRTLIFGEESQVEKFKHLL
jgi:hypothetical protein